MVTRPISGQVPFERIEPFPDDLKVSMTSFRDVKRRLFTDTEEGNPFQKRPLMSPPSTAMLDPVM